MDVLKLLCLTLSLVVFASEVRALRKSLQIRKRRNKKLKQNNQQEKLQRDVTDLSNLVAPCANGSSPSVPSLFGGLFLSQAEVDSLVRDTQEEISPTAARKTKTKFVTKNRVSKTIGTIQTFAAASGTQDQTCCETELKVTAPETVEEEGKALSVVHMNHSYQYVQQGECVNPGAACRGIGLCTQIYKYAFMLLYDPADRKSVV